MAKKKEENPLIEIRERLAVVETRLNEFNGLLQDVKERVEKLDNRLWWILGTVILTIIMTLLTRGW